MSTGFVAPDFHAPLNPEDYVARVPASARIKGMMMAAVRRPLSPRQRADFPQTYIAFKDYPLVDHLRLLAKVAERLYPTLPLRSGLRRIGQQVFGTFAASLAGRVLLSMVGNDIEAAIHATDRAYQMSANTGRVHVLDYQSGIAHLRLEGIYNFIDCYHVGILEGGLTQLGVNPTVLWRPIASGCGEFEVRWVAQEQTLGKPLQAANDR